MMPIAALFGGFYTWLIGVVGARTALVIFAAGTVLTCTAALLIIIKNLVVWLAAAMALSALAMPAALLMALMAIIPANFSTVVAMMLSCDAAVFACKYHLNLVSMMSK